MLFCLLTLLAFQGALCYPTFQREIPNGDRIPSPCNRSDIWPGVGHELITGSGPLNNFGKDFLANGKKWTSALCRKDSDGDGKTNGEELGDPSCVWTFGTNITNSTTKLSLSHPGICEPIDSEVCKGKVTFLRHVDACQSVLNLTFSDWCPAIRTPDVKSLELRFDKAQLPALETNYFCQAFKVPADEDYHIIAWEALVDNPEIMHHLIMFICDDYDSERNITISGHYKKPEECGIVPTECTHLNIGWAFGMGAVCYNNDTGYLMGKSHYKTVILQIHYNNPTLKSGLVDSSGVKIYYTPKRRPNDMAVIRTGQNNISIPPHSSTTTLIGRTFRSRDCKFDTLEPYQSYKITSMGFHMHKMGKHAKLTLEKQNGTKIVIVDNVFTYDRPIYMTWDTSNALTLEPGDNFVIECTYETSERNTWTFFGKNTADEMCLGTMDVHPRPKNANFLELSNYGFLETCDEGRKDVCLKDAIDAISSSMARDKTTSLKKSCTKEPSCEQDPCCMFLNKHGFFAYECVYDSAYELVKRLIASNEQTQIHNNIVKCVYFTDLKKLIKEEIELGDGDDSHAMPTAAVNLVTASLLPLLTLVILSGI